MPTKKKKNTKRAPEPEQIDSTRETSTPTNPSQPCYVDRLPFEIISTIFRICESQHREEWGNDTRIDHTCAAIFWKVSTYWRAIALGTPELWSVIRIWNAKSRRHAKTWLLYSKRCDIEVEIPSIRNRVVASNLGFILAHLHRARTFKIDMRHSAPRDEGTLGHVPRLLIESRCISKLSIISVRFGSYQEAFNAIRGCPNVEVLDLSYSRIQPDRYFSLVDHKKPLLAESAFTLSRLKEAIFVHTNGLDGAFCERVAMPLLRHVDLIGETDQDCVKYQGPACSVNSPSLSSLSLPLHFSPSIVIITLCLKRVHPWATAEVNRTLTTLGAPARISPLPHVVHKSTIEVQFPFPRLQVLRLENCEGTNFLPLLRRYALLADHYPEIGGVERPCVLKRLEISRRRPSPDWNHWKEFLTLLGTECIGEFSEDGPSDA